jgi:probable HAF family extracellular repeat protein
MTHRIGLLSAVLAVALIVPVAGAQTHHQHGFLWTAAGGMHDLGVPTGWTDSFAAAISKSGLVVGSLLSDATGKATAAAWTAKNGWQPLKKGLSAQYSAVTAVNGSQQIVGVTYTTGTTQHAFLWTQTGGMQDLGTLGGDFSVAYGINKVGEVVGYSTTTTGSYHAFLWTQSSGMQDLGALDAGSNSGSVAYAINDNGTIVGGSTRTNGHGVAVFWANGQIHILSALATNPASSAIAINKLDQIVGADSVPKSQDTNAFLWTQTGGLQDLGFIGGWPSGSASGVNSSGEVVGYDIMPSNGLQQAFVWTSSGGIQGLGTLGGPSSVASGINDSGQVVGVSDVP